MTMRLGSLFSGCEGFGQGFEQAGFELAWMCEIDPSAQSVLRYRYPNVPLFSDVREVGAHNLAPVDVITWGSPCQDLSIAGKRAGFAGERSGLFFEAIRVISELRPRFAIWENVPGALSSAGGADFAAALDALAEIGALDIGWRVLDSKWTGVPQQRRRVFVVADLAGTSAGEVLSLTGSVPGNLASSKQAWQSAPAATGSRLEYRSGTVTGVGFSRDHPELASTLGTGASAAGGHRQDLDTAGAYVVTQEGFGLGGNPNVAGALTVRYHKGINTTLDDGAIVVERPISFAENQRAEVVESSTVHALSTGGGKPGMGYAAVREGLRVRRLTPVETERLQGWPDDWTRWGVINGAVKELADTHRYRLVGNGVTANVAHRIAENIAQVLEGEAHESVA